MTEEMIQEFLKDYSLRWTDNTYRARKEDLLLVERSVGPLDKITNDEVIEWLKRAGFSPATTNRRLTSLKMFSKWAVENGYRDKPITAKLVATKKSKRRKHYPTLEEAERIIQCAEPPFNVAFAIQTYCGLRISEVLSLKWEHINWKEKTIDIIGAKTGDRTVPLPPNIERMLRELPWFGQGYVIQINGRKASYETARRHFKRAARLAEIEGWDSHEFSTHALRATCAREMLRRGASTLHVQKQLGHASPITTQLYADVDIAMLREVQLGK